jgi:hypothetical protein
VGFSGRPTAASSELGYSCKNWCLVLETASKKCKASVIAESGWSPVEAGDVGRIFDGSCTTEQFVCSHSDMAASGTCCTENHSYSVPVTDLLH